jgi:hypothetical protein
VELVSDYACSSHVKLKPSALHILVYLIPVQVSAKYYERLGNGVVANIIFFRWAKRVSIVQAQPQSAEFCADSNLGISSVGMASLWCYWPKTLHYACDWPLLS